MSHTIYRDKRGPLAILVVTGWIESTINRKTKERASKETTHYRLMVRPGASVAHLPVWRMYRRNRKE